MSLDPESLGGGEAPLFVPAHIEDSLAPAEHLLPADLEDRLSRVSSFSRTPGNLLERAWVYNEYALATPDFAGDDKLFKQGRADLKRILGSNLSPRNQIRINAQMLLYYEDAFRLRANNQPITKAVRGRLRRNLGMLMLNFMGEDELKTQEFGPLCELVATTYLMHSGHFPYLASRREEANMISEDNHDIYTLHPCAKNRVKKAPGSVKFMQEVESTKVVGLTIGSLALETAHSIPLYAEDERLHGRWKEGRAVRLAADIMACKAAGDKLDETDSMFLQRLSGKLCSRMVRFANRSTTPDYASNAEALRLEIAAREAV